MTVFDIYKGKDSALAENGRVQVTIIPESSNLETMKMSEASNEKEHWLLAELAGVRCYVLDGDPPSIVMTTLPLEP